MKQFWKYQVYKTMTFEVDTSRAETLDRLKARLKWALTGTDDKLTISSGSGNFGRNHIDVVLNTITGERTEVIFKLHTLVQMANYVFIPVLFLLLVVKFLILDSSDSPAVNSIMFVVIILAAGTVWLIVLFYEYSSRFLTRLFINRLIRDITK